MSDENFDYKQGTWPVCDESPLPAELLGHYIEQFGEDRARGYIDAVRDFQKHFQRCLTGFSDNQNGFITHQRRVGADTMVKKLYHRNQSLLDKFNIQSANQTSPQNH